MAEPETEPNLAVVYWIGTKNKVSVQSVPSTSN
jgi:hypothetical protein